MASVGYAGLLAVQCSTVVRAHMWGAGPAVLLVL